jgi:hypothetical protein
VENNNKQIQLEPCPFCGVLPVVQKMKVKTSSDGDEYQDVKVRCNGGMCHIRPSVTGYDREHAAYKWNFRA